MTSPVISRATIFSPTRKQFADLLAATTVVVYAVIATGAAVASTNAAGAPAWPLSGGSWESLLSGSTALVLGHQFLTVVAGVLLFLSLVAVWYVDVRRTVRLTVTAGAVLFPLQSGIGALLVLDGVTVASQLHLAVAGGIFVCLLVALGWTLEQRPTERERSQRTEQPGSSQQSRTPASRAELTKSDFEDEPSVQSTGERNGRVATATAYLELTKPRLMWLLCLLALAGMALATTTGSSLNGVTVVATLAGGVLAIGASGTFNHVIERDRDRKMARTADRPVATDRIPKSNAAVFGLILAALSMAVLVTVVNLVAAALTLLAIVYYSVIYTVVLKPNTTWNIAIGGGAGALPAVIGWAAVTGSVGLPALVLAGIVVVWTPAHFYNLAIVYRDDYARAGYPMYPVVSGVSATRRRILLLLGATLLASAALSLVTPLGVVFALSTVLAGAVFLGAAVAQCRLRTDGATLRTFHASNAYLGVVLLAIVVEALL